MESKSGFAEVCKTSCRSYCQSRLIVHTHSVSVFFFKFSDTFSFQPKIVYHLPTSTKSSVRKPKLRLAEFSKHLKKLILETGTYLKTANVRYVTLC